MSDKQDNISSENLDFDNKKLDSLDAVDEVAEILKKYSVDLDSDDLDLDTKVSEDKSSDTNVSEKKSVYKIKDSKDKSRSEIRINKKAVIDSNPQKTDKEESEKSLEKDLEKDLVNDLQPDSVKDSEGYGNKIIKTELKDISEKKSLNLKKKKKKKSKDIDDVDELIAELESEAKAEIEEYDKSNAEPDLESEENDESAETVNQKVKKAKILMGIIAATLVAIIILGTMGYSRMRNRNGLMGQKDDDASTATDADAEEYEKGAPKPELTDKGNNHYIFSWTNSNAAQFIVYMKGYSILDPDMQNKAGADEWQEVTRLNCSEPKEEMIYDTGRLEPYQHLSIKIVSVYGDEQFESEVFEVDTKASALYATIWTTKETIVFTNVDSDEQLGTIPKNTTLAVLDEQKGRFLVSTDIGEGYIDSSYCLINLPEYLGGICRYDITDSYASIINVQGYGIPEVTGKVIPGYEDVLLKDGSFVVPLLYPTAIKMAKAAEMALADGYVFKIYDSFRPYTATEYVYNKYTACVDYLVPEEQYTRITVDDYLNENYATVLKLSDLAKYEPEKASEGDATESTSDDSSDSSSDGSSDSTSNSTSNSTSDNTAEKTDSTEESEKPAYDPNIKTYENLMLGGSYETGTFLSDSASRHNLGVAVDVMLETLEDPTELPAQTGIFDKSYLSVQAYNNENVIRMKNYMENVGFNMVSSEWWHFQDNLTTTNLRPDTINEGLTIEGWKKDDVGWSYRLADGSYYVNTTENINGVDYMFNGDGYIVN